MGIGETDTSAAVTLQAKAGSGNRAGLDIILVCDFSTTMKDAPNDTNVRKAYLLRDAVHKFMYGDSEIVNSVKVFQPGYLRPDDRIALMRFSGGYQIFPEGEIQRVYSGGQWLPFFGWSYASSHMGDTIYCDTNMFIRGRDTGRADSFNYENYCFPRYTLNMSTSWGLDRIWWQFTHQVIRNCDTCNPDTAKIWYVLYGITYSTCATPGSEMGHWGAYGFPLDWRLVLPGGSGSDPAQGTSIYYALWQAIRYSLTYSKTAAPPVIILLSDGADESSDRAFKTYNKQWPLPRHIDPARISATYNSASRDTTRKMFMNFMQDSISGKVSIYTILLDVDSSLPDNGTLWRVSNMDPKTNPSGTLDQGHFFRARGKTLDAIYDSIGKKITERVAVPANNEPMFIDEIDRDFHLVPGTLLPVAGVNTVTFDSIRVDSLSGPRTLLKFYVAPMDADQTFAYSYRFSYYLNSGSVNPQKFPINPDAIYSRAYYRSSANTIDSIYFKKDSIVVLSRIKDLRLSRNSASLDTAGLSGGRILSVSRTTPASDTGLTLYSLLRVHGSDTTSLTTSNVSAIWNFAPPASWINPGGTVSLSNAGPAPSQSPYVKVRFDSSRATTENAAFRAQYFNPQKPSVPLTDQLGFTVVQGTALLTDSVFISYGTSDPRNPLVLQEKTIAKTQVELSLYGSINLYALGRSIDYVGGVPTYTNRALNVQWTLTGFSNFYTDLHGQMPASTEMVPSVRLILNPVVGSLIKQSDSGTVTITWTNELGTPKQFAFTLIIHDLTEVTRPNTVAIFPADKYLAFRTDTAALESLFLIYDTLQEIRMAPGDTAVSFYSLLFSRRGPGLKTLFKWLDTTKNWSVSNTLGKNLSDASGSPSFTYTNHFAPRNDAVTVTSAIDSQATINVIWTYGTQRRLTLEPRAGSLNDNLTGTPVQTSSIRLDPVIEYDSTFAVVRDEFGNFIQYTGTKTWNTIGDYSAWVTFSGDNPAVVRRVQNSNQSILFHASIPSGSSVGGITLSSAIADTTTIQMNATGYDSLRIFVSDNFTVQDTGGFVITPSLSVPSNRVIVARARASIAEQPHFTAKIMPKNTILGWQILDNAVWRYTNKLPFTPPDTGKTASNFIIYPTDTVSFDTLICTWPQYSTGANETIARQFRDTVIFRSLPAYAAVPRVLLPETLTAGTTVPLTIFFLDANGDTVKLSSLLTNQMTVYATDTALTIDGRRRFLPSNGTTIPINFTAGYSRDSLTAFKAGPATLTLRFTLPGLGTVSVQRSIFVEPGPAFSLQIVFASTGADCSRDTLSTNPMDTFPLSREYQAIVRDAWQNLITDGSVLNQADWSLLTGDLETRSPWFTERQSLLNYNANGLTRNQAGVIACRIGSITDDFQLTVLSPVRVIFLSTHEWVADPAASGPLSPDSVLNRLFGLDPSAWTAQQKLDTLAARGYPAWRDGYLDYLDIALSDPLKLTAAAVESLCAVHAVHATHEDSALTLWKGRFSRARGSADIYGILPADSRTDSLHTRYRIWLKPSFLFLDPLRRPANPPYLETGLVPRLTINNTVVLAQNRAGVRIGSTDRYEIPAGAVQDSAAPVIDRVQYTDNRCINQRNTSEIFFSEPVRRFDAVNSQWSDFRQIRAFANHLMGGSPAADTLFMSNPKVVDSVAVIDENGQGNMTSLRLVLNPDSSIPKLTSAGGELRLAVFSQISDYQVYDLSGNSGNASANRWVSIVPTKTEATPVCEITQITSADIQNCINYRWENNFPLFPWWGPTLVNPYAGTGENPPPGAEIHISVYVFDLLGNLVASPDKNKCLHVSLSYDSLFRVPNTTEMKQTEALDYNWLYRKSGTGTKSPCGVLPAWNALNNKGRQVAPGGYIIKLIVNNGVNPVSENSLKLILTNRKRG